MKTFLPLALMAFSAAVSSANAQNIRATVNGEPVYFADMQPSMTNGRVMVPLRGVFEKMGATVMWYPVNRTVIAKYGGTDVKLPVGTYNGYVDGRSVTLDSPAIIRGGRTMVPLRFIAESLGANVDWVAESRTVAITSASAGIPPVVAGTTLMALDSGTVIPCKLETTLSSRTNRVGDRFFCTIDPPGSATEYMNLPLGTRVEGHVSVVQPKNGDTPGVLGLDFDRILVPGAGSYNFEGALIGLDSNSVENRNGHLVARPNAQYDNIKWVGIGAGAGALIAVVTKGNVINNALIGAALGYLYNEIQKGQRKASDVTLSPGARFGVRLERDLTLRVPN